MKAKMINKKVITICIILGTFLVLSIIFTYKLQNSKPDYVYMHASWTYRYKDVAELTDLSDCIAKVTVKDNGTTIGNGTIPESVFSVEVSEAIYNCEKGDELSIYMTGGSKDNRIFVISDDPLMKKEEEYIIFAKKNTDGTFSVLGGSQGRMQYKDGKISSLNVVNTQVKESGSSVIKLDNIMEDVFIDEIQSYLTNK